MIYDVRDYGARGDGYTVNTAAIQAALNDARKTGGKIEKVLFDIIDTPVSPELLPGKDGEIAQKTEDAVGPYDLHDFFLYNVVRRGSAPSDILERACTAFQGRYSADSFIRGG